MKTDFARITEIAQNHKNSKIDSLAHYINECTLKQSHAELSGNKACGVDKVSKEMYEKNLDANLKNLVEHMKCQSYKPNPVKRVYIPKETKGKTRPLGIPSYEDKLVQSVLNKILNAIYEVDFSKDSYGFRPNRSCHDAIIALDRYIGKKVNYIVDADTKGFFDNVSHEWMLKFLRHRIGDTNILRLIYRFLKSGVMEEGKTEVSEKGTPQGGIISPILANIYLHYVLDLWFERIVKRYSAGEAYLIRYADDFVCCFQYKKDAERFYKALIERLGNFGLEIAEEKTKIIQFGRFAESNCVFRSNSVR
jgi:group II intron reverse transcriptase/maturase